HTAIPQFHVDGPVVGPFRFCGLGRRRTLESEDTDRMRHQPRRQLVQSVLERTNRGAKLSARRVVFPLNHHFAGRITQLELWRRELTADWSRQFRPRGQFDQTAQLLEFLGPYTMTKHANGLPTAVIV